MRPDTDPRNLKKKANKAAVDGTRQKITIDDVQKEAIQNLINDLADDSTSALTEDHCVVLSDALVDVREGSQFVKLLGALLLAVSVNSYFSSLVNLVSQGSVNSYFISLVNLVVLPGSVNSYFI